VTQELLVSFFFVFFFQISTDEKLLFSNEKAINCFIIASSYIGARAIFAGNGDTATKYYGAVANPAIALGICLAGLFGNGIKSFEAIYIYPTIPFAGAFLAVLFYELIYKKTQKVFSNVDDDGSDDLGNSSGGEHD
jgi:glycerol uptake facilitator-like aquaporin